MTETSSVHTIAHRDGRGGSARSATGAVQPRPDRRGRRDGAGGATARGRDRRRRHGRAGVFAGYLSEVHNRSAFVETGWVTRATSPPRRRRLSWITGRAKDLIIRASQHRPRRSRRCSSASRGRARRRRRRADAYAGELPVAFVQLKPGATIDSAELSGMSPSERRNAPRSGAALWSSMRSRSPRRQVFKPARGRRRQSAGAADARAGRGRRLQRRRRVVPMPSTARVVNVTLGHQSAAARVEIERRCARESRPLPLRHEIVWREQRRARTAGVAPPPHARPSAPTDVSGGALRGGSGARRRLRLLAHGGEHLADDRRLQRPARWSPAGGAAHLAQLLHLLGGVDYLGDDRLAEATFPAARSARSTAASLGAASGRG